MDIANFIAFLKEVKVPTVPTEMTFGVSRDQGLFEWAGTSLSAVFAQKGNIFRPQMWRMIFDIIRFNQFALDLLSEKDESEEDPIETDRKATTSAKAQPQESIGAYLEREHYSEAFKHDYLIPMTASVWSTNADKCSLEFPAITLVRFMWNHHLLTAVSARPKWMTIKDGSQQYIDAIMAGFPKDRVHIRTAINTLRHKPDGHITLSYENGEDTFDHIILATHGDQAMRIISDTAIPDEIDIFSGFRTSTNTAVLHSDLSLMPKRHIAWSSWNYMTTSSLSSSSTPSSICLTYWMNLLQHIPTSKFGSVLVTLNPITPPDPSLVQGTWTYHHPLYNAAAIHSQKLLPRIQNTRGISYAGAWTKYGFHEDGFSSGLKAAVEHLGAELPFEFVDSTFSRGRRPVLGWRDYAVRVVVMVVQMLILVFSMVGKVPTGSPKEMDGVKRKVY